MKTSQLFPAALAVVVSACVNAPSSSTSPVVLDALELKAPGDTFSVRSTLQLEAFGLYSNGERQRVSGDVSWSSSDPDTIAIDQTGVARLVKSGRARVTVKLDGKEAGHSFVVSAATARGLELYPNDLFEAPRGLTPQLRLYATFSDGTRREVTAEAQWTASGTGTWPLSEPGRFQLDAQGDVELIARFSGLEARKAVRVLPASPVSLRLEALESPLRPGESLSFRAVATFTDGASRDVTLDAIVRSLDGHIAEVQGTAVRGVSIGRARIVAQYASVQASRYATVVARQLVSLVGNLPHADVAGGRSVNFRVVAAFDDGTWQDVTDAALWLSSDASIAEVGQDAGQAGRVTGRQQGFAQVTARYGAEAVAFTVTTTAPVLEDLGLSLPSAQLVVGQRATFAVYGRFSDGAVVNLSQVGLLRSSPLVGATLAGDLLELEGLSEGAASVEVEVSGLIRTLPVTVVTEAVTELLIERRVSEAGGPSRSLRALARYADGSTVDVTELCDWSSADPSSLDVSAIPGQRGELIVGQGGAARISATMAGHGASFDVNP
ncbi:MAG: hypothetical protein SFW67_15690 [Myxococcaceae bacterium]|nr:hypothetical protein [Myxococcaceae bacterium]